MNNIQTIKDHLEIKFKLPKEQIEQMMPSFIDTLQSHMVNLQDALCQNDLRLLGRAGHTIKGAFLNLGLEECAFLAQQIEKAGKSGDLTVDYAGLIGQLELELEPIL